MSGASISYRSSAPRLLRDEEWHLVQALLKHSPAYPSLSTMLSERLVTDMNDGGMGSIRFESVDHVDRVSGLEVAKATYRDEDAVEVNIALNLDQYGDLFELDFWKVDFSPLLRYPRVSDVTIIPRVTT